MSGKNTKSVVIDDVFKDFEKHENAKLWEYDSYSTLQNFIKFFKDKQNG